MRALLANPTFNPAVSWSFRAMIFVRLDPNWSVFCLDHKLAVKLGCFENLRCIWSNPLILLPTRPNMPCLLAIAFLHLFFLISTVSSFLVWWTPLRVFGWATGCRRVMFTPRSSRSWQAGSEPDTQTARAGIKQEVDSLPPSWPMLDNVAKHCCCYRQADQIWGKTGQEMGGRGGGGVGGKVNRPLKLQSTLARLRGWSFLSPSPHASKCPTSLKVLLIYVLVILL